MTIAATTTKQSYSCNGVTVAFDFTFPVFSGSDLLVIKRTISTGAESTLALNTDYTTSATNNDYSSGGRVTLTTAPSALYQLIIMRNLSATQETSYDEGDAFPAAAHEQALDKLAMLQQQANGEIGRSLRAPRSDSDMAELPNEVSRASKYLGFDVNGDPVVSTSLPATTDITNLLLGSRYATLAAAVTAAGATLATILIDGALPIGGNTAVPATCSLKFLRGGNISGSDTLTINGAIEAGLWQIFGSSLTVAGSPKVEAVYPQWFGAVGDGTTDDTAAIQAALSLGSVVRLRAGSYRIEDTLTANGSRLEGDKGFSSQIVWYGAATGAMFEIDNPAHLVGFENVYFSGRNACQTLVHVTGANAARNTAFMRCNFAGATDQAVLLGDYTNDGTDGDIAPVTFFNCEFQANNYGVVVDSANALLISLYDCFMSDSGGSVLEHIYLKRGGSVKAYNTYFGGQPTAGATFAVHVKDGWVHLSDCEFEWGQSGSGGGVLRLEAPVASGLTSRSEHVSSITGCRILCPGQTSTGYVILIESAMHSLAISNSFFTGRSSGGLAADIVRNAVAAQVVSINNIYTGRPFSANATALNITSIGDRFSDSITGLTRGDSTAYVVGQKVKWPTGTTVWECTTAGTTDVSPPDITGKVIGNTLADGTATWTLRHLTNTLSASILATKVKTITANSTGYQATMQDDGIILAAGACTITLPTALGSTGSYYGTIGKRITVYQSSTSTSNTVVRSGTDTIGGGTAAVSLNQYAAVVFESDGFSAWNIISYYKSTARAAASTGVGSVKMGSVNAADNAGWLEVSPGKYVPYWTNAVP